MISINFASRNYRFIERVRAGLAVANILLLVSAAVIIWSSLSLSRETKFMNKKIKELEAVQEQFRPLLAERDKVVRDITAMSGLIESRRFSWTRLLTSIERVFPVGVALDKVEYNRRERALVLDGAARSPESLRNFMVGLEKTAEFKNPYLKHQSIEKGSISFNVVASYDALAGAGLAQRK